jgi:hypothetical protein
MSDQAISPKPKIVQMVCTVCGFEWEDHTATAEDSKVTVEICIRLLLDWIAELEQDLERFMNPPTVPYVTGDLWPYNLPTITYHAGTEETTAYTQGMKDLKEGRITPGPLP